ncbi:DUF2357 domain-containing protein [Bacteroides sp. 519]|uniref:DUF2357 domain-containing protein n=1 Tax=Bacteroides sp. 519 TaxID=2302937 RepID=UPI0013D66A8C|nr:DUF2357 domain-containing protein [Bacteroides sp. 519]NDV59826.1 DUF2357 domain-containing protein [Bacteroides sp. 519]
MNELYQISVPLEGNTSIALTIYANKPGILFEIDKEEAFENGESRFQLVEGSSYEYLLPPGYKLEKSEIIRPSGIDPCQGRIITNIYVGSLDINVWYQQKIVGFVTLEIRSVKAKYRTDYRQMLQDITTKCTDLLLQQSSLVTQTFTADINKDPQTIYQRFAFVESIIRSDQFIDSLYKINSMPAKRWRTIERHTNICNIRRANNSVIRQIASTNSRTPICSNRSLSNRFPSLPNKVNVVDKTETTDIPENRFVKYVLETFMQFCLSVYRHPKAGNRLKRDALASSDFLERYLSLPVFRDISHLNMIPLNSPVLQRKEGYREILQSYLMFDMAASLIWQGGDDVYKGGKRDVAALYEYWLFFKLLDLMEEVFGIKPRSVNDIIESGYKNGKHLLELKLKQGHLKMIAGTFVAENRKLHIEFCYNRTFSSSTPYPQGGSWTRNMRPDYTLSIWPEGISQTEAEEHETIAHIHFDAKYKIDNFQSLFQDIDLNEEKQEQAKGNYKRADLLKMHAYKDAIRRTVGAYILYPGNGKQTFQSFHELLPGLGAFAVSPSNSPTALKAFLHDIVQHFLNRASQRELYSIRTYNTFRETPGPILKEPLPDKYGMEHPQTTYVLVGYYKDNAHLEWILKNKIYNTRTDNDRGSLKLSHETTTAKYLLLHGKGSTQTNLIFRLTSGGPQVISKERLKKLNYPFSNIKPYYISFSLESSLSVCSGFGNIQWDVSMLSGYQTGRGSALPFTVTVEELMQGKYNS